MAVGRQPHNGHQLDALVVVKVGRICNPRIRAGKQHIV